LSDEEEKESPFVVVTEMDLENELLKHPILDKHKEMGKTIINASIGTYFEQFQ
jgi:hypothetical protein